jgi:hypothetical protein
MQTLGDIVLSGSFGPELRQYLPPNHRRLTLDTARLSLWIAPLCQFNAKRLVLPLG